MRIMGLDIGTKNIGVALSDEARILAGGHGKVLRQSNEYAVKCLKEIIEEFNVTEIVVGLPINMNGTKGPRAIDSENFAEKLREETGLTVRLWDERLSTKEAESIMIQGSMTRKKRKTKIDKLAAQIILQGYLDSL